MQKKIQCVIPTDKNINASEYDRVCGVPKTPSATTTPTTTEPPSSISPS